MTFAKRKALVKSYLGKTVDLKIDRLLGSSHPRYPAMRYPVNYGYIPGILGGDEKPLDVYLLGVDTPVEEFTAKIIGIVYRKNDAEDKLVAAPEGMRFTKEEIIEAVEFQEQYFESKVKM